MSCGCGDRARRAMRSLDYQLLGGRWYDANGHFVIHDVAVNDEHTKLLGVAVEAVLAEGKKRTSKVAQRLFG